VIVSHDRDLLNDAVDSLLHVDRCRLTFYQGNYDSFDKQRREKQALLMKFKKKQDEARRHMQSFVDRFRYKASKARQAQSRLKAIAKLEPVAEMIEDRVAPFIFPEPKKPLNPPLIRLEHAAAGYIEGKPVLNDLELRIDSDDRIALLGQNGNGKSTLAKVLCGKLALARGTMHHHKQLAVGYFAQHQIDELDEALSPYDYFRRLMPDNSEAQRRAKLGHYGFGSAIADSKCAVLSGGEKARLLFALASFHAPHLLVLDEPTNHLDVDSREALIHAINDYEGCVVLISHDKHLIETTVDRLWLVAEGTVRPFDGDIDDYTRHVLDQARGGRRARAGVKANGRASGAAGRQQAAKLEKKVREIDSRLAEINEKIGILDRALADERLYAQDPNKARKFSDLRAELQDELDRLEHRWLEAQSALEAMQS
jgi:ATP-binding cassette, subfamily F, member 3